MSRFNINPDPMFEKPPAPPPPPRPNMNYVPKKAPSNAPLEVQIGGTHYKQMKIQPVEFIHANGIGFCEGNAIKYLCRWREKGGIEDLRKAKHYIDLLISMESDKENKS